MLSRYAGEIDDCDISDSGDRLTLLHTKKTLFEGKKLLCNGH